MKIMTKIYVVFLVMAFGGFAVSLAYGSGFARTTLKAEQMRCSSCLRVIDAELRKIPGVTGMTAIFSEGLIVVDHESAVTAKEICSLITGLSYPATVVSEREIAENEVVTFQRAGFGAGAGCCNPGGASPVAESWKELRRLILSIGK